MAEKYAFAGVKKTLLLSVVLLLVLLHPFQAEASGDFDFIKVGLKYGNTAVEQCNIASAGGFVLGGVSEEGFTEALPLPAYSELTATAKDGRVELRDSGGVLISADIGINGCLMPYEDGKQSFLSLDGQSYRGGILLRADSSNMLTVINYLPMDDYLYGVIHREMSMQNPLEALKAQAVAARTFAAVSKDRHYAEGFNVCATTHCQVYGGCKDEYASTNQAVDETSGVIIRYKGEAAEIYYHKNSGGHTQNSEDVWSTFAPHLRGIVDPYSPEYPWQAVISFSSLQQKLIQAQLDPGPVESVRIGGRDGSGAVSSLVIKGKDREVDLTKSRIRAVLGSSLVRSRHFSIGSAYEGGNPPANRVALTLLSAQGEKSVDGSKPIYAISAQGKPQQTELTSLFMTKGSGTVKVEATDHGSDAGTFDDSKIAEGGTLTLSGLGYGHGVGMSQDGAIEMAKQGMDYIDILNFYFTDIEVN